MKAKAKTATVKKYRVGGFSGRASGAAKQAQGQMQAAQRQVKSVPPIRQLPGATPAQIKQAELQRQQQQKQGNVTSRSLGSPAAPSGLRGLSATEKANQQKEMEQARNSFVADKMGRSLGLAPTAPMPTNKADKKITNNEPALVRIRADEERRQQAANKPRGAYKGALITKKVAKKPTVKKVTPKKK